MEEAREKLESQEPGGDQGVDPGLELLTLGRGSEVIADGLVQLGPGLEFGLTR